MYKMLVLDIDGTIFTRGHRLSQNTKRTLKALRSKGIIVCIATGRNIAHSSDIIKELELDSVCVMIDGMVIYDTKRKKTLMTKELLPASVKEVIDTGLNHNLFLEIVTEKNYFKYVKNSSLCRFSIGGSIRFERIKKRKSIKVIDDIQSLCKELTDTETPVLQIIAGGEQEELDNFARDVNLLKTENMELRSNLWENYIFINSPGANKLTGVEYLCDYYGVSLEEVVAIGDELNDLEMLSGVGMGVAMGNGLPRVKEAADFITRDVSMNGAVYAINKFFDLH